jgi:hypothetical protein
VSFVFVPAMAAESISAGETSDVQGQTELEELSRMKYSPAATLTLKRLPPTSHRAGGPAMSGNASCLHRFLAIRATVVL